MLKVPYFKQNRDYTCGPACLRMVLAYYGIQQDEVTLTMLCGTDVSGTALEDIANVARRFKLSAERSRLENLTEAQGWLARGIPFIADVDAVSLYEQEDPVPAGHLVVVIQVDEQVIFHDPERGAIQKVERKNFDAAWQKYRRGAVLIWQATSKNPVKRARS